MKVKKFEAESMPEVMTQVKKEMGADAVILNSKIVYRGGILGFFKKKNIEVIAAIDPGPSQPKRKPTHTKERKQEPTAATVEPVLNQGSDEAVLNEIKALKKLMENHQTHSQPVHTDDFQALYEQLSEQEVSSDITKAILTRLQDDDDVKTAIKNTIEESCTTFGGIDYNQQFIHFVGPTGVGKTTTIAKVAAQAVLTDHKKVAFITTDTYRIAAIDQLKTYAKLLEVPIEVAYSIEDYMEAREKFKDYDLVLVDTAGRNFRDPQYVLELKKLIDFNTEMETYLVLSLTSRYQDMQAIYDQFNEIPIKQLIFTKADETSTYGAALNMLLTNRVGTAYITNGQNVPDDIRTASAEWIASRVAGDKHDA